MTDFPDLKMKALVQFPARVNGGTGIDVTKTNGNYQLDLNFGDFAPPVTSIPTPTQQNALLWNSATDVYTLAPILSFGAAASNATPLINGVASAGVSADFSRADHIHPVDTSRASAGANSDITSLSGLTTPLSVAQGGTGDTGTAWTTYTPTVVGAGGATGTATGRFKRVGKTVAIQVQITITAGGASITASLPAGVTTAADCFLIGREVGNTGAAKIGGVSGSGITPVSVSSVFTVALNDLIKLSGVFEAA